MREEDMGVRRLRKWARSARELEVGSMDALWVE